MKGLSWLVVILGLGIFIVGCAAEPDPAPVDPGPADPGDPVDPAPEEPTEPAPE